jgi:HEAT repeat protein
VRRNRWISGLLLTGVATAPIAVTFAADAPTPAGSDIGGDVAHLQAALVNPASESADRDEAARRLLSGDAAEFRSQIRSDLQTGDTPARLAILNAIATASDPDPGLIPLLGPILGGKGDLTKAAAAALANYRDHPEVIDTLGKFAGDTTKPAAQRSAVILAMGALVDQGVAKQLMGRLEDPREPVDVHQAAADALGALTDLDFGSNTSKWTQWWAKTAAENPERFVIDSLKRRDQKNATLRFQMNRLTKDATGLLEKNYLDIRDKQPGAADATLLSYLNSSSPEIRILGASQDFSTRPPSDKVRTRLREMISDSDDAVRREAVDVVLTINDHGAMEPLLEQLNVEHDPVIKSQIVRALGKIEDKAAVPALLKLVHGQQLNLATLAALQIAGPLGEKLREDDSALADSTSANLRNMVNAIASIPADNDLRAACMRALATLRDPKSEVIFRKFLQPGETTAVQTAAIDGLGNLGDTKNETLIAAELDPTADRAIRLAAAHALVHIATPEFANALSANIKTETDPDVRDALWQAFKSLFNKMSAADLKLWADQFSYDPPKRLDILIALAGNLAKDHNEDDVASTEQEIADVYTKLNQPDRAITYLQKAIDYWQQKGTDEGHLDAAVDQMMQYKLKAERYTDAVDFAAAQIHIHQAYERAVIPPLKDQANQLLNKLNATPEDLNNAKTIVTDTLKIPNLEQRYIDQLQDLLQSIQLKIAAQSAPAPH